jgi:phosphatidylglycerol:prolipoprotein diacylglycerol transferase
MPSVIELGPISIHLYSIMIFIGAIVAITIISKEGRKWNIPESFIVNMAVMALIFGVIGARIYYVIFNWEYYGHNLPDIFKIWEGGLAIHGGIIAGLIVVLVYAWKYKVNMLRLLDIIVLGLIVGQAIGRWGNFFNGEAYGIATTLETLKAYHLPNFIIEGMNIGGIYYTPTFLMESLWCLLGFVVLLVVKNRKYNKIGQVTSCYLMWYGFGRFFIEWFRTDSLMLFDFKIAQIISIIMFIIGLVMFIRLGMGSKFENLYNDVENGEKVVY